jgi:16S rRNA (cytosine967-C5)-methyltransferase
MTIKLPFNILQAIVQSLKIIFEEAKYADKVIEKVLKSNPKWGSRDRKMIAETTYDMVRWWRLLHYICSKEEKSIDYWQMLGAYFWINKVPIPALSVFKGVDFKTFDTNFKLAQSQDSILQSIPDWLYNVLNDELGPKCKEELAYLNKQAEVVLRVNSLKTDIQSLSEILSNINITTQKNPAFKDALILEKRQNVFNTEAFKNGLFEVQDASSQLIAPFLDLEPGLRVIDACAGAGGKSLHIASEMKNRGKIISMDVESFKLVELQKRAKRAGISIIETKLIEDSKTIKRLEKSADRLLLDVPCSGLGVLRRNPDTKWKLSPEQIENVKKTQANILNNYSSMLKVGGTMVYATCSILPSENECQIKAFLENNNQFQFIEEQKIWPSAGFDGFYMCKMKRIA